VKAEQEIEDAKKRLTLSSNSLSFFQMPVFDDGINTSHHCRHKELHHCIHMGDIRKDRVVSVNKKMKVPCMYVVRDFLPEKTSLRKLSRENRQQRSV